jgi:hypothetical protein
MAAIDFPTSPIIGTKWPQPAIAGTPVYTWDGEKWTTYGVSIAGLYVAKAGDVMSGHLSLPTAPAAANAVRRDFVESAIAANTPPTATVAEYIANSAPSKYLTSGTVWGAAPPVTISDSTGTITCNLAQSLEFSVAVTAVGRTVANPINQKDGQKCLLYLFNSNGTITNWGNQWVFPNGVRPMLTPGSSSIDLISFTCFVGVGKVFASFSPDFK